MNITFDCLRDKEVVNCRDGKRLGCVCDLMIDTCSGRITHIILPPYGSFFSSSKSKNCIVIPWENIEKIGDDIIIVRCNEEFGCCKKH